VIDSSTRAPLKHLLILDVDGTLVSSLRAEALLYPRACEVALGLDGVSSDWGSYACPSDRGIVRELVERHYGREATAGEYADVERSFLALIRETFTRQPEMCRPVAGAIEAVSAFRRMPDVVLAVATAGWRASAMSKLAVAGFALEDVPFATSHDAEEKADIIRIAAERAAISYGVERFASVLCLGDSAGDARAAATCGFGFIGIDTSGFVADVKFRHADFLDLTGLMRTLAVLQKRAGR
jgi:phosphoglycolate phosphatase-like HAD superfamily hydrolase